MKTFWKVMSYVLVAVMASALTMAAALGLYIFSLNRDSSAATNTTPSAVFTKTKLEELEALILERYIGDVDQTALEDAAASAMVDAMGDKWSYYIPAADYQAYLDDMANAYVGIGITIQVNEDIEGLLVIQVNSTGPAYEAGIQPGDVMVAVDGVNIVGMSTDEVADLIKGEAGTYVDITMMRGEEKITFTVERRQVMVEVVTYEMLEGNVGLVTIVNFHTGCADAAIAAIEELVDQGAEAFVFDVRNNGGGYVNELVPLLDYLLPEGPLFRTVSYTGKENVDYSDADCLGLPMAVLANVNSYSAAEFFAAALVEYEAAIFVGEQTTGKGRYQTCYELNDGSAVNISIGEYFTPKGENLADVGITPDIEVQVDEETFYAIYGGTLDAMEDPQILAALAALKK